MKGFARRGTVAAAFIWLALVLLGYFVGEVGVRNTNRGRQVTTARRPPAALNLRQFGAKGDGVTDDRPALSAAFDVLTRRGGGTLLVPAGEYKIVQTAQTVFCQIPPNTTIQGAGDVSKFTLYADGAGYCELFRVAGDGVRLRDLMLRRGNEAQGVMVTVFPSDGFAMDGVTAYGLNHRFGKGMHGMQFGGGGLITNVAVDRCMFRGFDYGVFQKNEETGTVRGVSVTDSTFWENAADDLEFNAPSGVMTDVTVVGCRFSDNLSGGKGAGFGVGLANVQRANVWRNTFDNYGSEPVHLEDRTADVTVSENWFTNCSTRASDWASHVLMITSTKRVKVTGNTFDLTGSPAVGVYAGPGAPGGIEVWPSEIAVTGNTFRGGRPFVDFAPACPGWVFEGNRVEGPSDPGGMTP